MDMCRTRARKAEAQQQYTRAHREVRSRRQEEPYTQSGQAHRGSSSTREHERALQHY